MSNADTAVTAYTQPLQHNFSTCILQQCEQHATQCYLQETGAIPPVRKPAQRSMLAPALRRTVRRQRCQRQTQLGANLRGRRRGTSKLFLFPDSSAMRQQQIVQEWRGQIGAPLPAIKTTQFSSRRPLVTCSHRRTTTTIPIMSGKTVHWFPTHRRTASVELEDEGKEAAAQAVHRLGRQLLKVALHLGKINQEQGSLSRT